MCVGLCCQHPGPSIIPLATTVWIVIGIVLIYWVFVPATFFAGLAAWPGSFNEYDGNGSFYNQTEGRYTCSIAIEYVSRLPTHTCPFLPLSGTTMPASRYLADVLARSR